MTQQKRKQLLCNVKTVLQDDISVIAGAFTFGGILYLGLSYADIDQMHGNLGVFITYSQIILHRILALLFGLFISATIYKMRWMKQSNATKTSSGLVGGFLSTVIIGCPACSIGLASYLGFGGILINLPGFGLEIKLLGLIVLLRATWTTLRDLYVCKIVR